MSQIIDLRNLQKQKSKKIPIVQKKKKNPEQDFISWQADEPESQNKNFLWFGIAGLFILAIVIFAIFSKSALMALLFILIGAVLYLSGFRKPQTLKCSITKTGIVLQKRIYNWTDLESFWIFYDSPRIKLMSIKSKKTLMPYLTMPLASENPAQIRKILLKYLPEKEQEESLIDNIGKKLGL